MDSSSWLLNVLYMHSFLIIGIFEWGGHKIQKSWQSGVTSTQKTKKSVKKKVDITKLLSTELLKVDSRKRNTGEERYRNLSPPSNPLNLTGQKQKQKTKKKTSYSCNMKQKRYIRACREVTGRYRFQTVHDLAYWRFSVVIVLFPFFIQFPFSLLASLFVYKTQFYILRGKYLKSVKLFYKLSCFMKKWVSTRK